MEVLKYNKSLISIIKASASLMDKRLVEHGERVAYIMYCLLKLENKSEKYIGEACMLALLHDIGAYKTEEIDRMVQFETVGSFKHSIYGYQFLQFCNVLEDVSDAILYHHMDYNFTEKSDCKNKDLADKLHLADRIDVLLLHKDVNLIEGIIKKESIKRFSKYNVELFIQADKEFHIIENLQNNSYRKFINEYIGNMDFSQDDINKYLNMVMCFIDFRSEDTVAHTLTTVNITREICKLLELTEDETDATLWGAFFHDIGKLAIPLNIIEKKGKLTPNEYEIIKSHTNITREILSGRIKSEIVEIAARHHEKINGSGYPEGLGGKHLTMQQRIVGVADVLSALLGKRSYKGRFDNIKTMDIISSMASRNEICSIVSNCVLEKFDYIVEMYTETSKKALDDYYMFISEADMLLKKFG